MSTELKLRNIGNSRGVILPASCLDSLGASGPDVTLILDWDIKKRKATLAVKPASANVRTDPFACLDKYPDIWKDDPRSAVEIAEELKSERHDIDR